MHTLEEKDRIYKNVLLVWGIFFALVCSQLSFWTYPNEGERIFNSPDETANYFFIKHFSDTSSISVPESLNKEYGNTIHPRAVRVSAEGRLEPGSFLGMIFFYGILAKILGDWCIVFLTPVLSVFAVTFFYKLLKEIFPLNIAFISSLLLLLFPGFWYYNSRSMFHNVLFFDLAVFGIYYLVISDKKEYLHHIIFACFFFMLAVLTRVSEAWWLATLFLAVMIAKKNTLGRKKIIAGISGFVLIALSVMLIQYTVYGNAFTGAYGSEKTGWFEQIFEGFFPFGFDVKHIAKNFIEYFVILFWWLFIPGALGFFFSLFSWNKRESSEKVYLVFFLCIAAFLILSYGSWEISDNLDPSKITLGTSYVRYWMPVYAFGLPYVAFFFSGILKYFRNSALRGFLIILLAAGMGYLSYDLSWHSGEESLSQVYGRIQEYYSKRQIVSEKISPQSIIVTERSDKIFFPVYHVVVNTDDSGMKKISNMLKDGISVYLYSHLSEKDIGEFERSIQKNNIRLKDKEKIFLNEYLYTFEEIP